MKFGRAPPQSRAELRKMRNNNILAQQLASVSEADRMGGRRLPESGAPPEPQSEQTNWAGAPDRQNPNLWEEAQALAAHDTPFDSMRRIGQFPPVVSAVHPWDRAVGL